MKRSRTRRLSVWRRNATVREFRRLAESKGYAIEPCQCAPPRSNGNDEAKKQEKTEAEPVPEPTQQQLAFDTAPLVSAEQADALAQQQQQHKATTADKIALKKYHHQRLFVSAINYEHWAKTQWHMDQIRNVAASLRMSDQHLMQYDERRHRGSYGESANVLFTKNRLLRTLCADLLTLQSPTDTQTMVTREHILRQSRIFEGLYISQLRAEFNLEPVAAGALAEFKPLLGAINQVLRAWGFAELKKQGRVRTRTDGERSEVSTYKLGFRSLLGTRTVLDLAKDSRYFL